MLGWKARNVGELKRASSRQRVADPERTTVHDSNHIAGPRFLYRCAVTCQELLRRRKPDLTCSPYVHHSHTSIESARADAHTNAMRSRCLGSMFAWILNTKPVNDGSVGLMRPAVDSRGRGAGANSRKS